MLRRRWLGRLVVGALAVYLAACARAPATVESSPVATRDHQDLWQLVETIETRSAIATASPPALTPTATAPPPLPTSTPQSADTLQPTSTPHIHLVKPGETLTSIAERFNTTVETIQQVNDLADVNSIVVDQALRIAASGQTENPPAGASMAAALYPGAPVETAVITRTPDHGAMDLLVEIIPAEDSGQEVGILHNQVRCPSFEETASAENVIVGRSAVCRLPIEYIRLGTGEKAVVLIGGIHGGYEWNTVLLAYELVDHLRAAPDLVPASLTVYVIPNANPDGLFAVSRKFGRFERSDIDENALPGRFNGTEVDLNRNWDCNWTPNAVWRDQAISGGYAPFSEDETRVLRDFITAINPEVVVLYHSAAFGVYASGCGRLDPASKQLGQVYGTASGYPVYDGFQLYPVTGDAGDWLSTQDITAFAVELSTHEALDWDMNRAGIEALLRHIDTRS